MIWIILLGWLYVMLMVAAASDSVIYGIMLFVGLGILPTWLILWFWGIPLRRLRDEFNVACEQGRYARLATVIRSEQV